MRPRMSDSPRVTLGVTTYNVERYLARAFDAVLAQDFTDFEVVVCDNQSTDGTWDICRQYAERDSRFRIHRNETNLGQTGNFERVVSLARGEYFRLTAHDDLMAPALLSRCVEALDADPDAVLAYPGGVLIDEHGDELFRAPDEGPLTHPRATRRIVGLVGRWQYINELFGVIRTDVLRRTRLSGPYVSADRRMVVELLARGSFVYVPQTLFYRRVHEENSFGAKRGDVYQWLEPDVARSHRGTTKAPRIGSDYFRLTVDTVVSLLRGDLPLPQRLATAATFGGYFTLRRLRTWAGRQRRRIRGLPLVDAPPVSRPPRTSA